MKGQIYMPTMRGAISSSRIVPTLFSGGIGIGSSQDNFVQNVCPPLVVQSIFYGGIGLGSADDEVLQSFCPRF